MRFGKWNRFSIDFWLIYGMMWTEYGCHRRPSAVALNMPD